MATLAIAYVAWSVLRVYSDLRDAETQARALTDALAEGDADRARSVLAQFQEVSDAAADRTDSIGWGVAERVPFVGDDARALATVSALLSTLGRDGVAPLVDPAEQVSARAYAPADGQFPLEGIAALEEPATRSHEAFRAAADELATYDSEDFVGPLTRAFDQLRTQVTDAERALDTAARASRLMPALLGADGDRDYLYVFQNNAEVRSTGGLPGNISLVSASAGRVEIVEQASGAQMGELPRPVLPLTAEEREVFGAQLGTYFLDANFTPDFPRAAELWQARWRHEFQQNVDGVFTVDPVTLSYLLEATGPVQVGAVELTAENVVRVVESLVYLNEPDPLRQDEFLNAVAKQVFDTFASGAGDPVRVIQGLYRGVSEGRVRLHSFTDADQAEVAGTEIAGELAAESTVDPQVGVYLNDGTGSKMSYYLHYDVTVAPVSCDGGRQQLAGRFQIESRTPDSPEDLPDSVTGYDAARSTSIARGQQLVIADLVAPVGGSFAKVTVDDEPLDPLVVESLNGRKVVSLALLFDPGQVHRVTWELASGPGQVGQVAVAVTPGVVPENESSTVRSAC